MTAEIAILNREAVAIAADSAATVSDQTGQKIFSSANKIFALSKHKPIGIMIYGNAHFMGVPWEILIKVFRKALGDKHFDTLKEYGDEFIRFLQSELAMFPETEQEKYAGGSIYGYFMELRNEIVVKIENTIEQKGGISQDEIKAITESVIIENKEFWKNGKCVAPNPIVIRKELKTKYSKIITKAKNDVFEKIPFTKKASDALSYIATELFICFPEGISNGGVSGVVVTGFGEKEIFPSIISYSIEGIANNFLKYKEDSYQQIDYDNSAMIVPFAQMEMVQTFIDGISPLFNNLYSNLLFQTIENYPKIILDSLLSDSFPKKEREKLEKEVKRAGIENLKKGIDKISKIQYNRYVEPILKVVTFLPKNELAEMAESLVNLTCLRKKISMDDETVGGPVDVAVISKGDGLVWIKRKHYFEQDLNKHFFINYLNK